MKVKDLLLELREMNQDAKVRFIKNLGDHWEIKTSDEFVLARGRSFLGMPGRTRWPSTQPS